MGTEELRCGTGEFRCVECNAAAAELHRDYSNGILKITICSCNQNLTSIQTHLDPDLAESLNSAQVQVQVQVQASCHKPVDRYIEYDLVVILIDAVLCKTQAFRHILFNTHLNVHWKLCVFCLLCESYLRWSLLQDAAQSADPADIIRYTREWDFYQLFGQAALELAAFCGGVLGFLWLLIGGLLGEGAELKLLLRALLLSCYGKVLLIPAVIWEHDYSPLCRALIRMFVLTSNTQAVRVVLNSSGRVSVLAVAVGLLSESAVAQACQQIPWLE